MTQPISELGPWPRSEREIFVLVFPVFSLLRHAGASQQVNCIFAAKHTDCQHFTQFFLFFVTLSLA